MTPNRNQPKVSVLMPVWNGERYLAGAIESILTQTFYDFELLIIDDGSTDRTPLVIRDYHDHRIRRVENEKNIGITKSLNHALELARGQYVARMDADDISSPQRLARQGVAAIEVRQDPAQFPIHVGVGARESPVQHRGNREYFVANPFNDARQPGQTIHASGVPTAGQHQVSKTGD